MLPYKILVLSSGVWWSLLPDVAVCDVTVYRYIHVCKPTFWRNLLTQYAYCSTRMLLTRFCSMCHCIEHKLPALHVRRPEQNTALNTKPEQFITAKIPGNTLKQWSQTHSKLRQRSSQVQKHQAARISRRIAVEQRRYAAEMADTKGDSLKLAKLHRNWEYA